MSSVRKQWNKTLRETLGVKSSSPEQSTEGEVVSRQSARRALGMKAYKAASEAQLTKNRWNHRAVAVKV